MKKKLVYDHKTITYRVIGKGSPVLLIHGFGEDRNVWKNQVEYLENKFHLIIPDLPGSGESELIDDMSMEGMADTVHAITLKEKLDPCHVIGHSMGGYVTLAYAEKYPNHLNSMGLFHSTAYADPVEKKAVRRKGIEFIREHGAFEFLKTSIPNLFSPFTKEEKPEMIKDFIVQQRNFTGDALVSYYEAMINRPDRTNLLENAHFPVLFIMGNYDNAIPINDCLKQSHLPEKSYIHILRRSGHMGMLEEPETCNRILENFLGN